MNEKDKVNKIKYKKDHFITLINIEIKLSNNSQ